jgi:transcriptional regulator with XRE-family HTH domain
MPAKAKKPANANDFYAELGRAIRFARVTTGKSQTEVGDHIGVSFQQVQKYENGANRIPVEQLVTLATYLEVSLDQLLRLPAADAEMQSLTEKFRGDNFIALLEAWGEVKDQGMRAAILNIIRRAGALKR